MNAAPRASNPGRQAWLATSLVLVLAGCNETATSGPAPGPSASTRVAASAAPSASSATPVARPSAPPSASAPAPSASVGAAPPKPTLDPSAYKWLSAPGMPKAVDSLAARFPTPPGYKRVKVAPGSFAKWLRNLPLTAPGTPVLDFAGEEVVAGDSQYLGAVLAMDVGKADVQHSTDAMIRLHAEWLYGTGKLNKISYESATGMAMPASRWMKGDRLKPAGAGVSWLRSSGPKDDYPTFREYLQGVFTWANSTSLWKQSTEVAAKELRPGDFLMHNGKPNHAVMVLDMARREDGGLVALLGRSLIPAESFQVLRLGPTMAWFGIEPLKDAALLTPGTVAFPWGNIRRFE